MISSIIQVALGLGIPYLIMIILSGLDFQDFRLNLETLFRMMLLLIFPFAAFFFFFDMYELIEDLPLITKILLTSFILGLLLFTVTYFFQKRNQYIGYFEFPTLFSSLDKKLTKWIARLSRKTPYGVFDALLMDNDSTFLMIVKVIFALPVMLTAAFTGIGLFHCYRLAMIRVQSYEPLTFRNFFLELDASIDLAPGIFITTFGFIFCFMLINGFFDDRRKEGIYSRFLFIIILIASYLALAQVL